MPEDLNPERIPLRVTKAALEMATVVITVPLLREDGTTEAKPAVIELPVGGLAEGQFRSTVLRFLKMATDWNGLTGQPRPVEGPMAPTGPVPPLEEGDPAVPRPPTR